MNEVDIDKLVNILHGEFGLPKRVIREIIQTPYKCMRKEIQACDANEELVEINLIKLGKLKPNGKFYSKHKI